MSFSLRAALILGLLIVPLAACAPALSGPGTHLSATLPPALPGERRALPLSGFGDVGVYADLRGSGRPLILTSSVNAAASAYEVKPLWEAYAGTRPVYALEWPGFGSSDRPDVRYTKELMTSALTALVAQIGGEVDVVSLSLGSEFAVRAALQEPRIRSLALISPSGLGAPRPGTQAANAQDGGERLYRTLNAVSSPLYGLLRLEPVIESFLDRSFRGPVDAGLVQYSLATTRQLGAKYAPVYFISGQLFTPDAYAELYSKLTVPTLVLYDKDAFVSFDRLPLFAAQPGVQAVRIEGTDGLPHFEKPAEVKAALDAFWGAAP